MEAGSGAVLLIRENRGDRPARGGRALRSRSGTSCGRSSAIPSVPPADDDIGPVQAGVGAADALSCAIEKGVTQRRNSIWLGGILAFLALPLEAQDLLPDIVVPGEEARMAALRDLLALHHPGTGPKATLWDQWLVPPALWPATKDSDQLRAAWREALLSRKIDDGGYVSTHQHASIAHPDGWPFPFWNQGPGNVGWHFSFAGTPGPPWRKRDVDAPDSWSLERAQSLGVDPEDGWRISLSDRKTTITSPEIALDTFQAPFMQIRWANHGARLQPALEWQLENDPRWYRVPLATPGPKVTTQVVPLDGDPHWHGTVVRLRLACGNRDAGGQVVFRAMFGQYDTRQNVNSQALVRGSADYFYWTHDVDFLRAQMPRLRRAVRHLLDRHALQRENMVVTTWPGHDGRSGFERRPDGTKVLRPGHGIGDNYWDLLPFGNRDAYATILALDAVCTLERLEREADDHPDWHIPPAEDRRLEPDALDSLADAIRRVSGKTFWNEKTGRFVACIDADGVAHDYGYTFLNLDAIHYGLADVQQANSILDWIDGLRSVAADTSTGDDIYHWRFAPRSSTRRNVDWYGWYWSAPESIPWGGQVQDGGAVLGFSYFDVMSRLKMRGPDDAWRRYREILDWFAEVRDAGGYRAYYDGSHDGTLQGGGKAGGLGLDREFFESALLPQVMIDGFLGFRPTVDGFALDPRLPVGWPSLTVDGIRVQDRVLRIEVTPSDVRIAARKDPKRPIVVRVDGKARTWQLARDLRIARD